MKGLSNSNKGKKVCQKTTDRLKKGAVKRLSF
jgi:hypothetical protein